VIGWLLDTNVISELARPGCAPRVAAWAHAQDENRLFISILSLGEYDKGVHNLAPDLPSRGRIAAAVAALEARFAGRILSLDDPVVRLWGQISGAVQQANGRPPPVVDTLLAASPIVNNLFLATRNVRDVADSGAVIFNPWTDDPSRFVLSS